MPLSARKGCLPERIVLGITAFFGFMNLYLLRFSFAITSLSMITPQQIECNSTINCSSEFKESNDWDDRTRAIMLSSFTYGYSLTQIVGGRLAELYGGKIVFGSAVVIPALLGLLIPKGAELSYWVVAAIRFFQGLFQGMGFPSMQAIYAVWIPHHERSKYMAIVSLSASFSIVWVMPLSGYLTDVLTWQSATYIVSSIPILWGIFWANLVYKTPATHPRITKKEREFIENSVQERGTSEIRSKSAPWKSIFTSLPFYAAVMSDFGNAFGFALFLNQMPNFLKSIYNYELTKTSFMAGLPFLCRYIGASFFSIIADYIIKRKLLKVSTTRRIFSIFGLMIPAAILGFNAGFGIFHPTTFISLSCLYMFFNGSIASSSFINYSDFAPNFSGTLFGISNSFASLTEFAVVLISGEILNLYKNTQSFTPWIIIFGSCVPLMICGNIFFLIFMRGSPVPWNFYKQPQQEELTQLQ